MKTKKTKLPYILQEKLSRELSNASQDTSSLSWYSSQIYKIGEKLGLVIIPYDNEQTELDNQTKFKIEILGFDKTIILSRITLKYFIDGYIWGKAAGECSL